jgi:ubiquinone/menaquinone biosynthesis C-methylase UbiE
LLERKTIPSRRRPKLTERFEYPPAGDFIKRLLRPERAELTDPFTIINYIDVQPYDHVADIGCGPGFFSIPLAKYLVYGRLYALDIDDEMLAALRTRVDEVRLGNVQIMKCEETSFPIAESSLDGVFLAFVTHHPEDRIAFLSAARGLLKPRGWCAVLEWFKKETESGPPMEHRIDPSELQQLGQDAGFQHRWWRDLNGQQYMAMLRNR